MLSIWSPCLLSCLIYLVHTKNPREVCDLRKCTSYLTSIPSGVVSNGSLIIPLIKENGNCSFSVELEDRETKLQLNFRQDGITLEFDKNVNMDGNPLEISELTGDNLTAIRMFWDGSQFGIVYGDTRYTDKLTYPEYVWVDETELDAGKWTITSLRGCEGVAVCNSCGTPRIENLVQRGDIVTATVTSLDGNLVDWFSAGEDIMDGEYLEGGYNMTATLDVTNLTGEVKIMVTNIVTGESASRSLVLLDTTDTDTERNDNDSERNENPTVEEELGGDNTIWYVLVGFICVALVFGAVVLTVMYIRRNSITTRPDRADGKVGGDDDIYMELTAAGVTPGRREIIDGEGEYVKMSGTSPRPTPKLLDPGRREIRGEGDGEYMAMCGTSPRPTPKLLDPGRREILDGDGEYMSLGGTSPRLTPIFSESVYVQMNR